MRTLLLLVVCLTLPLVMAADTVVPAPHPEIAADLEDASKVSALKSQLSGTWQIYVTDPAWTLEANIIGRALAATGKNCGLTMKWGYLARADHYVWPVILPEPSAASIAQALTSFWVTAGAKISLNFDQIAPLLYARVISQGMGFLVMTTPTGQKVNVVFMDGRQINSTNDLAAYDYSVASAMAGFDHDSKSPIDADYSFALSGVGPLSRLAGKNDTRLSRLCRVMFLERTICDGVPASIASANADNADALLAAIDRTCAEDGDAVTHLRKADDTASSMMRDDDASRLQEEERPKPQATPHA